MLDFRANSYDEDSNASIFEDIEIDIKNICSHCKNTGKQMPVDAVLTVSDEEDNDGWAFTACTYCTKTTVHILEAVYVSNGPYWYKSIETIPRNTPEIDISNHIEKTFPDFTIIYSQAKMAESNNLTQLAGMGFRKAVEFLIIDYLKWLQLDDVKDEWLDNPSVTLLNKSQKIPSERIRKYTKAISYLGNDETHYSKRHPDYDINAMKAFIVALISEIENDITFEEVEVFLKKDL